MNNDNFEQSLTELYQARRKSIKAPQVTASSLAEDKPKYRNQGRLLAIVSLGSVASFGVFALVSHLIKPIETAELSVVSHQSFVVEIEEQPHASEVSTPIVVSAPAKVSQFPETSIQEQVAALPQPDSFVESPEVMTYQQIPIEIDAPELSHKEKKAMAPNLKVLPKYPKHAALRKEKTAVHLSFDIDAQGQVVNITVDQAAKHIAFNRAAKDALKQWKFPENQPSEQRQKVAFDFTPTR